MDYPLQLLQTPGAANAFAIGIAVVAWVLGIVIHVAFALGVAAHARGRRTVFVGRALWSLATLLGGPLVALAYWVMHASALVVGAEK